MSIFNPRQYQKQITWWHSPLGQAFLTAEIETTQKIFSTLLADEVLILGNPIFRKSIETTRLKRCFVMIPECLKNVDLASLQARHDKLPIVSDGIELVYLAHTLAFVQNPHEVLREAFRVLKPEGHLLITGFNPWSLWGLWRFLMHWIKPVPWDGRFISIFRLKDWLSLLGFEILKVDTYFFRWCWPIGGAGYVVLARKKVITLTPIRPIFKQRPSFLGSTDFVGND